MDFLDRSFTQLKTRKWLFQVLEFFFLAVVFGLSYTQDPIYSSAGNQHTKFLHGLANAGRGFLSQDWFASTTDPLPVFSFLVQITYSIHVEYLFYFYYFLLFGAYAWSIVGIVSSFYDVRKNLLRYLLFLILLIAIHTVHIKFFDVDTGKFLHQGVAKQSILMDVFQPACFGAFILMSVYLFLIERRFLAILALGLASNLHPAYIPSMGALVSIYIFLDLRDGRSAKKLLSMGVFALILVMPVVIHMGLSLIQPSIAVLQDSALDIIVNERIPHHADASIWATKPDFPLQLALVIGAAIALKRSKLRAIVAGSLAFAVCLTLLQIVSNSSFLALVAPWRISVFLVPLSSCVLLVKLESALFEIVDVSSATKYRFFLRSCVAILTLLVIYNSVAQVLVFLERDNAIPLLNYINQTKESGSIYLVPPDTKKLQKFRLYTGAPIFVNRKTHPYRDAEVIEWDKRLGLAEAFYNVNRTGDRDRCDVLNRIVEEYGVSHVVVQKDRQAPCAELKSIYSDRKYLLYEVVQ
ncbi:hypothetical protein KR51_00003790 [Rubidibacter lacunae KORDI 51-2]|uniref:DUF6798 domain-containing protein n=1 Tax=Rubidibacter lacunae KORDI 51-2 TaxID=582515 RepID=U5DQF9_9CHRO|nr:DUF6798 domain-containing protein [Rubidibacter lacunae]ERN42854.1 hypothetical protein KR51_00003790 [Rubidibacter lacunae KORDI 51-2]